MLESTPEHTPFSWLSWFIFYRPGNDEFQAAWQAVVNTPGLPHLYQTAPLLL
jgi:hypothetical protein